MMLRNLSLTFLDDILVRKCGQLCFRNSFFIVITDMKNQCYNCMLADTSLTRNYKDFPYVNGTSDTNSFTH